MDDATTHMEPPQDTGGPGIRWDDLTIAKEAVHFPDDLRDDYTYLKCYARDRCRRDLDLLVTELRRLGIYHDKTTWSRVLRGRWNIDTRGEELASPVISADRLRSVIESIRTNTRAEVLRGKVGFIETTIWDSISTFVDLRRARDRVNKFGIIIGPTGSQKTACLKEWERRHNHGTTFRIEAPAGGALGEFLSRLGECSGLSSQTNTAKKRAHLLKVVQEQKVIIVDNAQDLYVPGRTELLAFNWLRQLQDETNCCVILSITPTFERELIGGVLSAYFEQFIGRSGGVQKWLRLPAYPPEEDVVAIADAFGMREVKRNLKALVAISREPGRIRRLFDDLQDGKRLAGGRKETLTMDHIREVRGEEAQ